MESIDCPLCPDRPAHSPYHEESGYAAVQCSHCGLVYVTPRPTELELKRLYEGQDTHIDLAAQVRKRHRKVAEANAALGVIAGERSAPGKLLEIGVGAGYFLAEARRAGWDAVGLDLNAHFVRFAREALGAHVVEGTLRAAPFADGSFDVVFHRNVLSHLAFPVAELGRMGELLRPGGLMVFETGNVAELPGSTFRGTQALALPDHLFHFSEATLRVLLQRSGFECVSVTRVAVLDQLGPLLAIRRSLLSAKQTSHVADRADARQVRLPSVAPPRRPLFALAAEAHRALTTQLGRALAAPGRRCSLIVVARRRAVSEAHA
jgi:SAM-dependent methyltransferase